MGCWHAQTLVHLLVLGSPLVDAEGRQVFFLMSSTPSRAHRLTMTLRAMDNQTLRPTRVILSIPRTYERFPGQAYRVPDTGGAHLSALLEVHRIPWDAGPLCKYFGVTRIADDDAFVVVGDDDVDYAPTFVEDLVVALDVHPRGTSVVASQLDDKFGRLSPGVMAYGGVACRARQLRSLAERYARPGAAPRTCFHADDVLVTYFFKWTRGDQVHRSPLRMPNVDDKREWRSESSINAFHAADGQQTNLRCVRDLLARHTNEVAPWPQIPFRGPTSRCDPDAAAARGVAGGASDLGASWWQTYWEPCVGCSFERRVGPKGDGGKWVCNPDDLLRTPCAVLSVGSNNDFRFEQAMTAYGCDVHVYDHTSNPPVVWTGDVLAPLPRDGRFMSREGASRVTFFKQALGTVDTELTVTVATAVKRLLAVTGAPAVDVFKLDCEGCEFRVLTTFAAATALAQGVRQLAVELHFNMGTPAPAFRVQGARPEDEHARRMHGLWTTLHDKAGMWPFHKEPNIQFSRGDCVELSFVNRRLTRNAEGGHM